MSCELNVLSVNLNCRLNVVLVKCSVGCTPQILLYKHNICFFKYWLKIYNFSFHWIVGSMLIQQILKVNFYIHILYIHISIYVSIYLAIYIYKYIYILYPYINLSIYLSICLSIYRYMYIYLSIRISIYLFIHLFIYLSNFIYIYLSTFISIYRSIYLSFYILIFLVILQISMEIHFYKWSLTFKVT